MQNKIPDLRGMGKSWQIGIMAYVNCAFFSESMGVSTQMAVLLPQAQVGGQIGMGGLHQVQERYPVLYLLHGWSDDHSIWTRRTAIERYVAERELVVVMPQVGLSYYQNTASGQNCWDFISEELPALVKQWFPVRHERSHTFAAGLSMGGYGAFRLGLALPDRFAAVASLSGALDIRRAGSAAADPLRLRRMQAIFGSDLELLCDSVDLMRLGDKFASDPKRCPRLYQWCGTEDFLYTDNLRFRDHAQKLGLPLQYREGPGDHSWSHWDREICGVIDWLLDGKPN